LAVVGRLLIGLGVLPCLCWIDQPDREALSKPGKIYHAVVVRALLAWPVCLPWQKHKASVRPGDYDSSLFCGGVLCDPVFGNPAPMIRVHCFVYFEK